MTRLAWAVALLCALVGAAHASPDESNKERARQLLAEGNARYAESSFSEALALFEQAYALYASPKLLVNTAACHRALGHDDRSATDLAEYLRWYERERPFDQRALADASRADLRRVEDRLGRIAVEDAIADGRVSIDEGPGRSVTYVAPGEHRVRVWHGAALALDTRVTLRAGRSEVVRVSARLPTPSITRNVNPVPVVIASPAPPVRRRRWVLPVAIMSALVVGGLALGLGLGLGLRHDNEKQTGDLGTIPFTPTP